MNKEQPPLLHEATIVITTKNRRDDLRRALTSSLSQLGDLEIIVVDDGCSDGTSTMLSTEFPMVSVIRHEVSTGLIVARNEAATRARGVVLFSIDDDAAFTDPSIVLKTLQNFEKPYIGAVAIPYADVNRDGVERQRSPELSEPWIADRFVGTAYAVRRDVFLKLGAFRQCFFHQGEESDFCLRMLEAGYLVRLGNSDRIDHFESPKRDTRRMDLFGRRNDVLFVWLNVPWPWLPLHLAAVTVKGILFGIRVGRPFRMLHGLWMGFRDAWRYRSDRQPVSSRTYRLFRRLRKAGKLPLSEIEADLTPVQS